MRYTLRLLIPQRFQRVATLICAAELLRQNRPRPSSLRRRLIPARDVDGRVGDARADKEAEGPVENARLANPGPPFRLLIKTEVLEPA